MGKNSSRRTPRMYSLGISFLTILWWGCIISKKTIETRRYTSDTAFESWKSILFKSEKILCVRTHPEELLACIRLEHSFLTLSWWWYIMSNKTTRTRKYTSEYHVFSMIVALSSPGWVPGMSSWISSYIWLSLKNVDVFSKIMLIPKNERKWISENKKFSWMSSYGWVLTNLTNFTWNFRTPKLWPYHKSFK